ncbi:MAG: transporter [Actinomycetota bacterium]|nr:transporter [Actinomycetota bacterium]
MIALPATNALPARAGGGHSFSGGGGGSRSFGGGGSHFIFFGGGGGGGGGGIGGLVIVIIVVVIVAAVVLSVRSRRGRSGAGGAPSNPGPGGQPAAGQGEWPPSASGHNGWAAGGGEAGSEAAAGAAATAANVGTGAGSPPAPPGAGTWSHDDRPAIESVRGDLFPGSATEGTSPGGGTVQTVSDGLAAIADHDPTFDREAFLDAAQRAFFVVQEAWTDRKPEMSRQVMADGLWQQHRVQIKGYDDEHKRNILGDLAVGSMDLVTAHSDASYDTITVRIRAACSDYDVADDSGKVIRGNKRVGEWTEDWTFQRSSKATTSVTGGTLAQKCPNCGAPLNVDLAGVCPYCKAPVMSGEYDWVLARISQVPAYS